MRTEKELSSRETKSWKNSREKARNQMTFVIAVHTGAGNRNGEISAQIKYFVKMMQVLAAILVLLFATLRKLFEAQLH